MRPRRANMFLARAARPAVVRPTRRWLQTKLVERSRRALEKRGGRHALATSADVKPDPSTYARVALILEDGSVFEGKSFGAEPPAGGTFAEVVFQTGMVGYAEALTDPSYRGQSLAMTYPMIGNYGVPDNNQKCKIQPLLPRRSFESNSIHAAAVICQDYSNHFSHWEATQSLGRWLSDQGVPGVTGIDTRRLTKVLREHGSMVGRIVKLGEKDALPATHGTVEEVAMLRARHLVDEVSITEPIVYKAKNEKLSIIAVDCGMKANMVREFNQRGVTVTAVPWDHDFSALLDKADGLFVSNGPGDPEQCSTTINHLRNALDREGDALRPIFGICLGNQLTGLACGASTVKMPFGNRGQNQPVLDALQPGACMVTSQNHGYAVDPTNLPDGWQALYTNANDLTNEGLVHSSKPFFTAQFHPEAHGGPTDASYLFDVFTDSCSRYKAARVDGRAVDKALNWPKTIHDRTPPAFPKKVLLLGSGGLSIGQAGEFDYSGTDRRPFFLPMISRTMHHSHTSVRDETCGNRRLRTPRGRMRLTIHTRPTPKHV